MEVQIAQFFGIVMSAHTWETLILMFSFTRVLRALPSKSDYDPLIIWVVSIILAGAYGLMFAPNELPLDLLIGAVVGNMSPKLSNWYDSMVGGMVQDLQNGPLAKSMNLDDEKKKSGDDDA